VYYDAALSTRLLAIADSALALSLPVE